MIEYIREMSITEADNLKKTIRDLFRQTCILQVKYDPATLIPKDNPRYQTCLKHREFIEAYLEVMGCELNYDPQEHIFRIKGEGVMTEKMSETTSLLVLIMKVIYQEKIMGEGLQATVTNMAEIREYGKNTNLINRKLTTAEWRDAITLMKQHQMIEIPGAVSHVEDKTPIYIYSTIRMYCTAVDVNEIIERYQEEARQVLCAKDEEDIS